MKSFNLKQCPMAESRDFVNEIISIGFQIRHCNLFKVLALIGFSRGTPISCKLLCIKLFSHVTML